MIHQLSDPPVYALNFIISPTNTASKNSCPAQANGEFSFKLTMADPSISASVRLNKRIKAIIQRPHYPIPAGWWPEAMEREWGRERERGFSRRNVGPWQQGNISSVSYTNVCFFLSPQLLPVFRNLYFISYTHLQYVVSPPLCYFIRFDVHR